MTDSPIARRATRGTLSPMARLRAMSYAERRSLDREGVERVGSLLTQCMLGGSGMIREYGFIYLWELQTEEERECGSAIEANGCGFDQGDAARASHFVKLMERAGRRGAREVSATIERGIPLLDELVTKYRSQIVRADHANWQQVLDTDPEYFVQFVDVLVDKVHAMSSMLNSEGGDLILIYRSDDAGMVYTPIHETTDSDEVDVYFEERGKPDVMYKCSPGAPRQFDLATMQRKGYHAVAGRDCMWVWAEGADSDDDCDGSGMQAPQSVVELEDDEEEDLAMPVSTQQAASRRAARKRVRIAPPGEAEEGIPGGVYDRVRKAMNVMTDELVPHLDEIGKDPKAVALVGTMHSMLTTLHSHMTREV